MTDLMQNVKRHVDEGRQLARSPGAPHRWGSRRLAPYSCALRLDGVVAVGVVEVDIILVRHALNRDDKSESC